jgi:hypothetical protein
MEMLNNGRTAAEIYALLVKVPRFKALLSKTAPKNVFAVPTAPKSMLQKRQAEKEEVKNPSPTKIQKADIWSSFKTKTPGHYLSID